MENSIVPANMKELRGEKSFELSLRNVLIHGCFYSVAD